MPTFIENRDRLLLNHIRTLLRQADKAYFALAFVRRSGVNLLRADIEAFVKRNGSIQVLFANDFGATEASAIRDLRDLGASLKFISDVYSFHPKGYIFRKGKKLSAIIGSSNLSASGLSHGTEWNVHIHPQDMDCSKILGEFSNLWNSPNARLVTESTITHIEKVDRGRCVLETLKRYDRRSRVVVGENKSKIRTSKLDYEVHPTPRGSEWTSQLYKRKLERLAKQGEFNIVVKCAYQTRGEKVFVIPFSSWRKDIQPHAHLEKDNCYKFEVRMNSCEFNWHHNIPMDGNEFVAKQ